MLLLVHVMRSGKPAEVKLSHSSGFERLDQAAIAHVQRAWHFIPARSASDTVDSWGEFAVTFPTHPAVIACDCQRTGAWNSSLSRYPS